MRAFVSVGLAMMFGSAIAQQGLLPAIKAKGDILVLAKVVSIGEGSDVSETVSAPTSTTHQEYKGVVLQPMDIFMGLVEGPITVAVPASEVDLASWLVAPHPGGWGFSGRGPALGLLPGDVSVWAIQRPDSKGHFTPIYEYPDFGKANPNVHAFDTAPGFTAMWAAWPMLVAGRTPVGPSAPKDIPSYDRDLEGPLRYMDLIGRSVVENALLPDRHSYRLNAPKRLTELEATVDPRDPDHSAKDTVVPHDQMVSWLERRVVADWPTDDVDQLNITAIRMVWEDPKPLQPTFLALVRKCGRSSLEGQLPPITDEGFFVEECENEVAQYAAEGFSHVRYTKNLDPRIGRAALKWLDLLLKDGKGSDDARSCGLQGDILWWLADSLDRKDLVKDWVKPSHETLEKAQESIRDLRV